nr:hypothetical protein FFPRI1PSEUD_52110 [Pseudomonas sp. FFPRI_1]
MALEIREVCDEKPDILRKNPSPAKASPAPSARRAMTDATAINPGLYSAICSKGAPI